MPELQDPPTEQKPYVSMMDSLAISTLGAPKSEPTEVPAENPAEEVPKEIPTEVPKETPKETPVKETNPKIEVETGDKVNTRNWRALNAAKTEIENERNDLRTKFETTSKEMEELRAKLTQAEEQLKNRVPEQDFDLQKQFTEREQQYIQQIEELKTHLRAADITRDPEFVAKYDNGRQSKVALLKQIAGKDFDPADEYQIQEIRDSLDAPRQRKFDAALIQLEQLDLERQEAINNAPKTYEQLQQRRQQQFMEIQKQELGKRLNLRNTVWENLTKTNETLAQDEELRNAVYERLEGLAGGKGAEAWTEENIMGNVAAATILGKLTHVQHQVIQGKDQELETVRKELETVKKEKEELDKFVKSRYGGLPSSETPSSSAPTNGMDLDPKRPMYEQIQIRTR